MIVKKKKKKRRETAKRRLCRSGWSQGKTERKRKERKIHRHCERIEKKNKLWNVKVTVIPTVIDAHGTATKRLIQGLQDLEMRGRVETIQTTSLLRSARILEETCCYSNSSGKPLANAGLENSQKNNNNIHRERDGVCVCVCVCERERERERRRVMIS